MNDERSKITPAKTERNLTVPRVVVALFVGAAIGGALWGFGYGWGLYHSTNPSHGHNYFLKYGLLNSLWIGLFAAVFWLIGLVVIAGPFWIILHESRKREIWHAALLGAGLLGLLILGLSTGGFDGESNSTNSMKSGQVWIWQDSQLTAEGWKRAFKSSGLAGLLGTMIGGIMWKISYRKTGASSNL